MDHVVDGGAALWRLVTCAEIQPHVSRFHFGAGITGALTVEMDHQQVKLCYELAHVFVQPKVLLDACGCFYDIGDSGRVAPTHFLQVNLGSELP